MKPWCLLGLLSLLVAGPVGCRSEQPFVVIVQVTSDEGAPLPDVHVKFGDGFEGETDEQGKLHRRVLGKEGSSLTVRVDTPEGYVPVGAGKDTIVLRHLVELAGGTPRALPIEFPIKLSPKTRTYAVLISTGIAGIPVEAFGQKRAITNRVGAAMFLYEGAPGESLGVKLDTTELPRLQPQSPVRNFQLGNKRQVFVFKEHFTNTVVPERKKPKIRRLGPRRLH